MWSCVQVYLERDLFSRRKAHLSTAREVAILAAQFLSMISDISHSRENEGPNNKERCKTNSAALPPPRFLPHIMAVAAVKCVRIILV